MYTRTRNGEAVTLGIRVQQRVDGYFAQQGNVCELMGTNGTQPAPPRVVLSIKIALKRLTSLSRCYARRDEVCPFLPSPLFFPWSSAVFSSSFFHAAMNERANPLRHHFRVKGWEQD